MAKLQAPQALDGFPVPGYKGGGILNVAYGRVDIAAALVALDTLEFCKLPPFATVVGGYLQGPDIDSGTGVLDVDIGWAANGDEVADPDGFGNFGASNGTLVANVRPESGIYLPFGGVLLTAGPKTFKAETKITGICNVAANAGGTGFLTAVVHFILP